MSYEFRQPYVSATLRLMPKRRHWTLAGGLEWTAWDQRPGDGPSPSVDTRFTPPTLPGLGADVTYVHSQATASFDRRPFAGYARRGGYYGVTAHDYTNTNGNCRLVTENGRSTVKHYLQDVGSTFGMCNDVHEWDLSYEYFYDAAKTRRRFLSLGFALSPWQTIPYVEYSSIGKFEGDRFDPRAWHPQTPTTAYMEMRDDDAFWAARRVAAFSEELIRAAVHTGQFSDPAAERHLGDVIIKRQRKIAQTYLTAINRSSTRVLTQTAA